MSALSVKGSLAALIAVAALAACGTSPANHPATKHHAVVTTPAPPLATHTAQVAPPTPAATTPPAPAPVQTTPPQTNPIPQNNGGDHDADNNGGPSDGDGLI
jgi:hypothetical protein